MEQSLYAEAYMVAVLQDWFYLGGAGAQSKLHTEQIMGANPTRRAPKAELILGLLALQSYKRKYIYINNEYNKS